MSLIAINPAFFGVLRLIYSHLGHSHVNWAITASMGLALQGIPVRPNDIDIQTDTPGAYTIEDLLRDYLTRQVAYSQAERIRSHFGELRINGIKVEIMGDVQKKLPDGTWSAPPNIAALLRRVTIGEISIPVLDLHYEAEAYRLMGRTQRAELLERWLAEHTS